MSGNASAILSEMFGHTAPGDTVAQVGHFETYKGELRKSYADTASGNVRLDVASKTIVRGGSPATAATAVERLTAMLEKSLSADDLASLQSELATVGNYI